jgi:NodT family efflux transporter outer membrane factor (OMF) lipoprotein
MTRLPRSTRALGAAACLLALAGLDGCMVGPDYERPSAPAPASYKETAGWKRAEPRDVLPRGAWWTIYGDPVLDSLAGRVAVSNQSIVAAEAQFHQAATLVQQARAALYPTLGASAAATRSRSPSLANRPTLTRAPVNNFDAQLDASWVPDLWGSVRRNIEANVGGWQANEADLAAATLAAQSTLAQAYLQLRVLDEARRVLEETVAGYVRSLELTRNRYAVGVVGKLDVVQAETQLASTQAQLIDLGVQRAQLEHAIAVLIGVPPGDFAVERAAFTPRIPDIPAGIPSELLERRPDIAAAERRVAAANARIGVADAAFFPTLTLSGAVGYRSITVPNLFDTPSRFWSLGALIAQPLFDAGLRRAVSAQARAAYDQEVALYRQTVLTAFQQVEDNLVALRVLEDAARVQQEALAAARRSVELTLNQYRAGTANYLAVVTVQAIAYANERTALALLGRRLDASVQLLEALGGGWQVGDLATLGAPGTGTQAPASEREDGSHTATPGS